MRVFSFYRDVPLDMAYPSAWRQRGYKVVPGSEPVAYLKIDIRGKREIVPLYGLSQTIKLRGKQAKRRRQAYVAALYGEEDE